MEIEYSASLKICRESYDFLPFKKKKRVMYQIKKNNIIYLFIILFAVSPAFALGDDNRNLLLISVMTITPIILFFYPVLMPKIDIPLIALCSMMLFFPWLLHPETIRWSTILYTCMFALYFMSFVRVLYYSDFSAEDLKKLLKWLLYAYFIVLLIQQFCVLTDLPIFNLSNYNPNHPWKLNSLMSEPSHAARIIPIIMYFYINLTEENNIKDSIRENKLVWISFLWPILTMGSATAFLFVFIVLLKFVDIRQVFSVLFITVTLGVSILLLSENKTANRMINFSKAVITLDEKKMIETDHSASSRVVPSFMALKYLSLDSKDGWFGHGVDYDTRLPKIPGLPKGSAGAFYIWINFGFLVAILTWIFTLRICYIPDKKVTVFIWFLTCFIVGGLNTQIMWFVLLLATTYKYVMKQNILGNEISME